MSDTEFYNQRLEIPPQRLVSEVVAPPIPQHQPNKTSKFYSHFLYKLLTVGFVLVVLPLFPTQAPDFVNQTIFTRIWELVHLLFVGIAVSYGLFSWRNVESEKENHVKIDTTQNYMYRIFQVSSVFDDEMDTPFGFDDHKVETWNSKYVRGEPDVVVAKESSVLDEQSGVISNSTDKPLFLPIRSLKSSVSDPNVSESVTKSPVSLSRSASGVKNGGSNANSSRIVDKEFGVLDPLDLEEKLNENVVLPSPIPWRSRSGRMEFKEGSGVDTPPMYSLPPSVEESEVDRPKLRTFSPMGLPSESNSTSPSPKKLSPSPSLSPELRTKSIEDSGKKKSAQKSSPPPAPSLSAPATRISTKKYRKTLNSNSFDSELPSEKKHLKSEFKDELKDFNRSYSDKEDLMRRRDSGIDSLMTEERPRTRVESSSMGRSVRTIRRSEPVADVRKSQDVRDQVDGKSDRRSNEVDAVSSVRTIRRSEPVADVRKSQEVRDQVDGKSDRRSNEVDAVSKEVDAVLMEKPSRRTGGFNQFITEESYESPPPIPKPKPSFSAYYKNQKKKKVGKKVILESEEYTNNEDDDTRFSPTTEEADSNSFGDAGPDEHEVDKKADEFIAKFREQIRLQRIESIKRSTGQHSTQNSSR